MEVTRRVHKRTQRVDSGLPCDSCPVVTCRVEGSLDESSETLEWFRGHTWTRRVTHVHSTSLVIVWPLTRVDHGVLVKLTQERSEKGRMVFYSLLEMRTWEDFNYKCYHVDRRRIGRDIRAREFIRLHRGESSHYTLPRVVSMCRPEGLTCYVLTWYYVLCDLCMLCDIRPDRRVQRLTWPEGPQPDRAGGSNVLDRTGGYNELWDWKVSLRRIDQRVLPSYSL